MIVSQPNRASTVILAAAVLALALPGLNFAADEAAPPVASAATAPAATWPAATAPAATAPVGEALETRGTVDAVTVYRGQALVTRNVALGDATDLREIVVTELPVAVQPGSVYAEGPDGVEVRSVRYRERAVAQDVRGEVRVQQEKLAALQFDQGDVQRQAQVLEAKKQYLDKLENFTAASVTAEMKSGTLQPETVTKLSEYLFKQREELSDAQGTLQRKSVELAEAISLVQRQLAETASNSSRSVKEAVVFANVTRPGQVLRLRYLVTNASWEPSYTVRAESTDTPVTLTYSAAIEQMTGEDWQNVEMILSTATPALVARAPELEPLHVTLTTEPAASSAAPNKGYIDSLVSKQSSLDRLRNQNGPMPSGGREDEAARMGAGDQSPARLDRQLNDVSGELQVAQMTAERDAAKSVNRPEESVSVVYHLNTRTALPSRADRQVVTVASRELPASFYKVATPVLTKSVYNEASVTNDTGVVLLAGPVNSYLGGDFVGQALMPTVAAGEKVAVGLGIDPSLRASRELVDKTQSVQGGNKVVKFDYALTIENFGDKPADVRVMERLPVSPGSEVRTTLSAATPAPATGEGNPLPKDGLLKWTVNVPAGASEDKAKVLKYTMELEYDRNMRVVGGR